MARGRKSWREKLRDNKGLPRLEPIPERMRGKWGRGTILIPAPLEVDEVMRMVPQGRLITINMIREVLAKRHGATMTCPMTTGIFARIAAEAAEEARREGQRDITPYWRTLKEGGVINEKYPGGVQAQKRLLEGEGHQVIQRGKRYLVVDFQRALFKPQGER